MAGSPARREDEFGRSEWLTSGKDAALAEAKGERPGSLGCVGGVEGLRGFRFGDEFLGKFGCRARSGLGLLRQGPGRVVHADAIAGCDALVVARRDEFLDGSEGAFVKDVKDPVAVSPSRLERRGALLLRVGGCHGGACLAD